MKSRFHGLSIFWLEMLCRNNLRHHITFGSLVSLMIHSLTGVTYIDALVNISLNENEAKTNTCELFVILPKKKLFECFCLRKPIFPGKWLFNVAVFRKLSTRFLCRCFVQVYIRAIKIVPEGTILKKFKLKTVKPERMLEMFYEEKNCKMFMFHM